MKSSHQTLMLGILMGLVAWVMDALISWHFFPGKSFYEMLFAYDPERTLYVRSTVVLLFFIFGMMAGRLLSESERTQRKLQKNVKLLDGIRRLHAEIVKEPEPEVLIRSVLPMMENVFALGSLKYFRLGGDPQVVCQEIGGETPSHADLQGELVARLPGFQQGEGAVVQPAPGGGESILAPVRLGGRLFGVLYALNDADSLSESLRYQHFMTICDDLGHAMAHLEDLQKLNTNAQKLTDLYNSAPIGIFTSTVGGKLLYLNPTLSEYLGADNPGDLLSSNEPVTRFYSDPHRREEFVRILNRDGYVVDFEVELQGVKGQTRNLLFAARLFDDPGEKDARIEGFAMDITRSKTAERENRILQKQLSESQHFKSITVLAGGVAHEFNNILQAMMGSAYLAQMRYPKGEDEIWRYLQEIQDSGKRAARLCDQMLSYAGKKAMLLKLEKPDSCLLDILKIVMSNAVAGVRFEKSLDAPSAQVRMDLPSFSEIINQLVTNAVEALPGGAGLVKMSTEVRAFTRADFQRYHLFRNINPDEYWMLRIEDDGSGISPDDLPHIFEPFYTTKFQGRGLGLPSIAGLVEKFDGSLGVRNREEKGTEFALWLPLAQSVLVEEVEPREPEDAGKLAGSGVIWVVDDEPLICMTIDRLLSPSGFKIHTANDGEEALEKIRATDLEEIRCLILDVTMPKMGGLETLQHLREFMPDLPVLIMSGYDESDSLEHFKNLKVAGFIHKPFRMEQLEAKLQKIME